MDKPYTPDVGIVYPDKPDIHIMPLVKEVDAVVDENYPYLDKSFKFKVQSLLLYFVIFVLVFFVQTIRFDLRIEGKKNLKKYKHLFKNGAMTISNHVFKWDFLCLLQAVKFRRLWFPLWVGNLTSKDRYLVRWAGGIPVPEENIHAMRNFNQAFDELCAKKQWLHAFPESSMWDYYQPIRPFKKGVFTIAYTHNLPVIPMAFSYREPKGIYRLFKKGPLVTLRIGEPILPDTQKPRKEAVNLLRRQAHEKLVELAGLTENPWPPEGD